MDSVDLEVNISQKENIKKKNLKVKKSLMPIFLEIFLAEYNITLLNNPRQTKDLTIASSVLEYRSWKTEVNTAALTVIKNKCSLV